MAASDKLLGSLLLLVAAVVFTYYTTWALFTPFLPTSHPLQALFPPREWAVRIPVALLLAGVSAVGGFIGLVAVKEGQRRRAKELAKKTK